MLKLIQASRRVGDFLERTSQILPEAPENLNGDTVGDWLLAEELGRGGMATVYSATRSVDDKSQSAAVKILRRGIDTDEVLARFHQERGALATLQHPYIAGLLDFGTTAAGRPWFALEKVEGVTITDWCKQRGLSSRERVQLFLKVGEGVQYAHRHLVVHRDLKASNVLVDSFGSPKLLDFGIAKMLDTGKDSTLTQDGRRLLTPDSAAPEQILGDAISTATDVYGLGVLLFHLLAERLPFAASSEKARSAVAALDAVLHSLPPRPSSVESCVSGISSALDAVVLKALAKDPNQRYPTVGDLMADLNRFLDGRPVSAKRWAIRQRLFYWVRRHQVAASIWAALLVGLTGTLIQGNRAQAALNDAEFRLQRMHSFAQMMFDYDEILRVHSGTTAM
ncbi:MAG: serine/threonine protein kinase, partial [Planctomycetes bacterium]|nr:serine/threonine protein kinase [Planctomycetota bacterium]